MIKEKYLKRIILIMIFLLGICNLAFATDEQLELMQLEPIQEEVMQEDKARAIESKEKTKITVEYELDTENNEVTAKIVSNVELKDTKPTWKLSEDKKIYTKTFAENTKYKTPVVDCNGNTITVEIEITQVQATAIRVEVNYDVDTNEAIAQIISNVDLKDTKPTWKLSENKKVYTKTFTENTTYKTPVVDKYGETIDVEIKVIHIQPTRIDVKYERNSETNEVIAKAISNTKLKDTKPTWKLSEDEKTYTKVFTANTKYKTPFVDRNGNTIDVEIEIKDVDETPPEINIEYIYNDDDTVTVYLKSNEELKDTKPTWKLSEDKKTYTKIYETGSEYSTPVQDLFGNETRVYLNFKTKIFTYKQEDDSTIKVRYLFMDRKKAEVDIISSIQMKDTKPTWKLSKDGYKYTKTFTENQIYSTAIEDINGKTKNVNIIINFFDNYLTGVDVSYHNGEINWSQVKNSGIDFAIIRIGYGQNRVDQDDKKAEYNMAECERLGIPYGVYLYSYALDVDNASSEADHVLRMIKGHNPTLGIWIDIEDEKYYNKYGWPTKDGFTDIAVTFCEKIKANGYNRVGIYASLSWHNSYLNSPKLDKYEKWVAQWGEKCSYEKEYTIWQYSNKGSVNGIKTSVDMDILYR